MARNILALDTGVLGGRTLLGERELTSINRCAAELAKFARDALPFWAPLPGPVGPLTESSSAALQFDRDLAGWVTRVIVLPALFHHTAALPSLEQADSVAAQRFAEEVLKVSTAAHLEYLLSVPVSGIDLDTMDALEIGSFRIRRLTSSEQGVLFDQLGGIASMSTAGVDLPHTVLELCVRAPRKKQYLKAHDPLLPVITALELHGLHPAGGYATYRSEPAWVLNGVSSSRLALPTQPRQRATVNAEALRTVLASAKRLERFHLGVPASPKDLALHRFTAGMARDSYADGVLDFTIALESLLLPYDPDARRGDLGYRFRVHGAYYLAERAGKRPEIAKQLRDIYDMRSRLVHGADYPELGQIRLAYDAAYDLARRGLLRAVQEGFPTAKTFNEMVLG